MPASAVMVAGRCSVLQLLSICLFCAAGGLSFGQTTPKDPSKTSDVLDGRRYLLRTDDITRSFIYNANGQTRLQVDTLQTSEGTPTDTVNNVNYGFSQPTSTPSELGAGVAMGRFYNGGNDIQAAIMPGFDWLVILTNSVQKTTIYNSLTNNTGSFGTTQAQMLIGDFNGDGFDDALAVYSSRSVDSSNPAHVINKFGMRIGTAVDVNQVDSGLNFGPEFSYPYDSLTNPIVYPLANARTLAVGDFNADGRDELAALMSDGKTIQIFTVDPQSLWFYPDPHGIITLPQQVNTDVAALVSGRFREDVSQDNKPYSELALVGGASTSPAYIYGIAFNPSAQFPLQGQVATSAQVTGLPWNQVIRVQATSGPLNNWASPNHVQLVTGITDWSNNDSEGFIFTGSFDPNFNYIQEASINATNGNRSCLTSIALGNFDNVQSGVLAQRSFGLSITAYETKGADGCSGVGTSNNVQVWNLQAPGQLTGSYDDPDTAAPPGTVGMFLSVGDSQGRSIRLGEPEVVNITTQIQPDVVLSVPPMHVDWVAPSVPYYAQQEQNQDCPSPTTPCVFNLTVAPSTPATNQISFTTGFNFSSSASSEVHRQTETSWGLSVKQTTEAKVSFGVPGEDTNTLDIKNAVQYAHDNKVAKDYRVSGKTHDTVNEVTGFADHLLYKERSHYIFYYPILGRGACQSDPKNCPLYAEFSVPAVDKSDDEDATKLEWYQPLAEPGNIFSYPWDLNQLQNEFADGVVPLTPTQPACRATDTSTSSYQVGWSGSSQTSNTVGNTNKISDDASVSYSLSTGIAGVDGASFKFGLDVGASASLRTLNINTQTLDASAGTTTVKPAFPTDIYNCCGYSFANYVVGPKDPAITFQHLTPTDNNGAPAQIQQAGPLFSKFIVDVNGGQCSGTNSWFGMVYNKPDVALNHPSRWDWNRKDELISFYAPDQGTSPLDQEFYWMKGFFITGASTPGKGPTLGEAIAGDPLSATVRVYNYSMVPANNVHVRVLAQKYCSSNASSEASCKDAAVTCSPNSLCGDAFQLGTDQVVGTIAAYEADLNGADTPNWTLVSVPFDTTNLSNMNLVFWVVTWMEDANGNLAEEMPDHGLDRTSFNPRNSYTQLLQIPVEAHSNNVGLYGMHTPFHVLPQQSTSDILGAKPEGVPVRVTVRSSGTRAVLDRDSKIIVKVKAGQLPLRSLNVKYYDGNPKRGGRLFDSQKVHFVDANSTLVHRSMYEPKSCGVHTIFAVAETEGGSSVSSDFRMRVTADEGSILDHMIVQTKALNLPRGEERRLIDDLRLARRAYGWGYTAFGNITLNQYLREVSRHKKRIRRAALDRLAVQVDTIKSCNRLR